MAVTEITAPEAAWLAAWREGPVRTRWEELPVQAGDAAPDLELRTAEGRPIRLSEVWAEAPALLLFWRHFGCGCGTERADRLAEELADYTSAGAAVALVVQGEPDRARAYAARYGIGSTILCDPSRDAYRAFGLLDGVPAQILYDAPEDLQRRDVEAGIRFAADRRAQGRPPVDSPWQMPGEFVVGRSGRIELAYRYQYCEDFPDPRVLTTAIRASGGGGS